VLPRNLESKLDQEKLARQRAETQSQEKARELSMLTVDNRQLQYRLDKIQADFRQEADKVRYYTILPIFDRFSRVRLT
jgi:Rho-associated protein kinase 1